MKSFSGKTAITNNTGSIASFEKDLFEVVGELNVFFDKEKDWLSTCAAQKQLIGNPNRAVYILQFNIKTIGVTYERKIVFHIPEGTHNMMMPKIYSNAPSMRVDEETIEKFQNYFKEKVYKHYCMLFDMYLRKSLTETCNEFRERHID